jgi:hypothetical protein
MFMISRRAACMAVLVSLAAVLSACGDEEPAQRKAFIAFLQDINNRTGIHFLKPSAKDEKDFGPYLQHYAIIIDYNKDMRAASEDFRAQIVKLGAGPGVAPRTIEQIAAAPQDLKAAKDAVEHMQQASEARLAKIKIEREALKQPDDLKAVYDKTFAKLVTTPTLAFEKSMQALIVGSDASIKLVDYINSHRNKLSISGTQIQAKDQRTLDEVGALLKAHQAAGEHFAETQREGERVVQGN